MRGGCQSNKVEGRTMPSRRRFMGMTAMAAGGLSGVRPLGTLAAEQNSAGPGNAPGITDTEIKIGQTMPYSGPISAYGAIGRAQLGYFKRLNEQGGINGRKINLISLDDGYSPPKTVEQVRRLVEQEHVAFLANTLGTAPNVAIRQYLHDNKVPQLFVISGAPIFANPQHYPWTIGFPLDYVTEAHIYTKHILANKPNAKIG